MKTPPPSPDPIPTAIQLDAIFDGGVPSLIHSAFRYYLGRMTIGNVMFAGGLADAWHLLPAGIASMIKRELENAFQADDSARERNSEFHPLGHNCDREAWENVRSKYQ